LPVAVEQPNSFFFAALLQLGLKEKAIFFLLV